MEQTPNEELINAIGSFDEDQVKALLETDPVTPFLTEGENSIILRAHDQIDRARSRDEHERARRILFLLLDTLAEARANGKIEPDSDLALDRVFASAVITDEPDLAESVLKAGLDPNGRLYFNDQPWLALAVQKRRPEIFLLLLKYGADPQLVAREDETLFQSLVSTGRLELAWIFLFHSTLGEAPTNLVRVFKMGVPDGSMESAIKDLNLDEAKALHLWQVMLENGCGRGAGAVAVGYCQGLGCSPASPECAMIISLFLERATDCLSGVTITYLFDAGFQFPSLTDTDKDLAQVLLCEIIETGRDDAMAALLNAGVTPEIQQITPQSRSCRALELVVRHRRSDMVRAIVGALQDEGDLILITLITLVQHDEPKMLDAFMSCCSFDQDTRSRLLTIAVEEDNAACLATLVSRKCHPSSDLDNEDITNQNFNTFLLARTILKEDFNLPSHSSRFDCARILLSDPNYDTGKLDKLCQLIIVARAQVGDHAAVYFLCSYGFPPIQLLVHFRGVWTDATIDNATKNVLADSLCVALAGLIDFFDNAALWNVKSLESEALNYVLPGCTNLDERALIAHILGWSEDVQNAPDLSLIELMSAIAEDEDNPLPANLQQMLDGVGDALGRALEHHFSLPSLVEIARDSVAQMGDQGTWNRLRAYLHHIYPTVIWEELEDRKKGYVTAIWSVIALLELHDIEYLAPLIFRPVDSNETDESSSDSFYYSESSDVQ